MRFKEHQPGHLLEQLLELLLEQQDKLQQGERLKEALLEGLKRLSLNLHLGQALQELKKENQ